MIKKNSGSLKNMIIYIVTPVIFMMLLSGGVNYVYSRHVQNTIIAQKETALANTSNMINQLAGNVIMTSNLLVLSDELVRVAYVQESGGKLGAGDYYRVMKTLQKYKATSEYVAGIALVDRNNRQVVSESGAFSFDNYFGNSRKYEQYPVSFWESVVAPGTRCKVLSMTQKQGLNKMVIPVVFNGIMNTSSQSLVVIDLDCTTLQNQFLNDANGLNSNLYLFDTETNNQIGRSETDFDSAVFDDPAFIERLKARSSFTYKAGREKYLIVTSSENPMMFDKILFVSVTPLRQIMREFDRIRVFTFMGYFLSAILLLLLTAYLKKRFYQPLKWMLNRMGTKNGSNASNLSELDFLKNNIDEMLQQNTNYQMQLSTAMPLACDRYFEKFLKAQDMEMLGEFEEFLQKSTICFRHEYFAIASVKFKFTEKFYQQFSNVEYKNVRQGILELLSSAVGTQNTLYILPVSDENYLLIVNLPDKTEVFNQIVERINRVAESFDNDIEFIRIEVSFGNPYEGFEGMRKSYNECMTGSYKISEKSAVWVSRNHGKEYKYSINDENKLFNMMVKGDGAAVEKLVQEVVNKSVENGAGYQELRNIYLQLYNTAEKVIATKNVTDKLLMGAEYINVNESVELMDNDSLFEYIHLLVKEATVYNNAPESKLNLEEITNYINENYAEDIYLELLAEKYGTSVKYLSRILKNYFGVSYIEYLGRVRIEHAKEFLEQSNLSVNDVMLKCGFNSRNTFIRAFKKYVGIVPSEYRSIYGKKTGKET